jgi:hypothetical protein
LGSSRPEFKGDKRPFKVVATIVKHEPHGNKKNGIDTLETSNVDFFLK